MRSNTSNVLTRAGILRKPLPRGGLVEAIMGKDPEPLRESRGMRVCGNELCCGANGTFIEAHIGHTLCRPEAI
jgi:hypothetical protein